MAVLGTCSLDKLAPKRLSDFLSPLAFVDWPGVKVAQLPKADGFVCIKHFPSALAYDEGF